MILGQVLTFALADALAIDETLAATLVYSFAIAETVSITEEPKDQYNLGLTLSENVSLADAVSTIMQAAMVITDNFSVGDYVCAHRGWQSYIAAKGDDPQLFKADPSKVPLSTFLGTVGMPGRTAYFGLLRVGMPKIGETIVVSAASGAVGTVVGQMAKILGCKAIGIAGGETKCSYVTEELGFDACVDYKAGNLEEDLAKACPDGIDIYFENVGGDVAKAVAPLLNPGARVPICGFISHYNSTDIANEETPFHVFGALDPIPEHRFFVVTEWMNEWEQATKEILELVENEKMKYRETITKGFENAPQALRDVLTGKNFGKQIIEV